MEGANTRGEDMPNSASGREGGREGEERVEGREGASSLPSPRGRGEGRRGGQVRCTCNGSAPEFAQARGLGAQACSRCRTWGARLRAGGEMLGEVLPGQD